MSNNPYESWIMDSDAPDATHGPKMGGGINGLAIASLSFGILSITMLVLGCCCMGFLVFPMATGGIAVLCGYLSRSQIKREGGDGAELALGGLICGYVAIGLSLTALVAFAIVMLVSSANELNQVR